MNKRDKPGNVQSIASSISYFDTLDCQRDDEYKGWVLMTYLKYVWHSVILSLKQLHFDRVPSSRWVLCGCWPWRWWWRWCQHVMQMQLGGIGMRHILSSHHWTTPTPDWNVSFVQSVNLLRLGVLHFALSLTAICLVWRPASVLFAKKLDPVEVLSLLQACTKLVSISWFDLKL